MFLLSLATFFLNFARQNAELVFGVDYLQNGQPMPETTIHEDGQFLFLKDDVRLSRDAGDVQSIVR